MREVVDIGTICGLQFMLSEFVMLFEVRVLCCCDRTFTDSNWFSFVIIRDIPVLYCQTYHVRQANMSKSNDRQSRITSQIVQNALLNNKGVRFDVVGCLLKSDSVFLF